MSIESRTQIKTYFETGDIPTEAQFINLIDSLLHQTEDDAAIETAYNNQVTTVSQVEAEAGTSTTVRRWTAQRVAQAIAALGGGGGGSAAEDDLTSGTVTAKAYRNGGTAMTITNPSAGEFNLVVAAGSTFRGADVFGNNTTLDGSLQFILRIDNSANSSDRWPLVQMYDVNTGALVEQEATSTNHSVVILGNITTITFPGMNLFGATGFKLIIR